MQSKLTILLLSACIVLFAQVQAACICDPNDQACLQTCVTQGQECITACHNDTTCYDQCIAEYWPGQSVPSSTVASSTAAPVTSASASSTQAATTSTAASVPASSSVASSTPVASSAPVASSSASVVSSKPVSSASSPANSATFSPTAPTSANPPQPTAESGAQSSFLVPAVAIGVASVTVITQFFFLARMGSVLFN